MFRRFVVLLVGVLIALAVADSAEAQRRRGRRGRAASPAAPQAPIVAESEDEEAAEAPVEQPTSAPTPSETPREPSEPVSEPSVEAVPPMPDLGPVREELSTVMDDLVRARSRMAILGKQLFRTRVRIVVHNRATRRQTLARLSVSLDDDPVYRTETESLSSAQRVFEGFAAPGPHAVTVELEQRGRDGEAFRYELRDTYRIDVPRDRLTEIVVVLDDGSDMASDFPSDGEGEYDVRTRVRVATRKLDAR